MRVVDVLLACVLIFLFLSVNSTLAAESDFDNKIDYLMQQIDELKRQVEELKQQRKLTETRIDKVQEKTDSTETKTNTLQDKLSWLDVSGDYRFRIDYLKGYTQSANILSSGIAEYIHSQTVKSDSLMTNRLGLNLGVHASEDITLKARFVMYKTFGIQNENVVSGEGGYFGDKASVFDANIGEIPTDTILRVNQAYVTWSNIFDYPVWVSVGRRPTTTGVPTNIRENIEKNGTAGFIGLLVDAEIDGLSLGYSPYIEYLPGFYVKICGGKFSNSVNNPSFVDTSFMGIDVVPYYTENTRIELTALKAAKLYAVPEKPETNIGSNVNIGDIDLYGFLISHKITKFGYGDINLFFSFGVDITHPNNNLYAGTYGLLWDTYSGKRDHTGYAFYLGGRYDIPTGTKIGLEYNYGSKYWTNFTMASDDMWTSKLGTRGNVYEAYLIQDLPVIPLTKRAKSFIRIGYQYYNFNYTGTNQYTGFPYKISDVPISYAPALLLQPMKHAHDIYGTFNVMF
ncbi:MAG: DUF3373 family protein [Nitrospirae bacterium]|nr:DUF3373 family protein [Nitrospirota bacterium]